MVNKFVRLCRERSPVILSLLFLVGSILLAGEIGVYQVLGLLTASALVYFFLRTFLDLFRYFQVEENLLNKAILVVALLVPGAVIVLDWPGYLSFDDLAILTKLVDKEVSPWHSISYSFLIQGLLDIFRAPFFVFVLNGSLYAILWRLFLSITFWSRHNPGYWLLFIFVTLPQVATMVFFQNRDSTYSLLLLVFIFSLLESRYGRFENLKTETWVLFVVALLLGDLRQEGKLVALTLPLFLHFYRGWRGKQAALAFVGLALALFLSVAVPKHFGYDSYTPTYRSTSLISPLTYILNKRGIGVLSDEEKQKISKVMSLEIIFQHPNPFDIGAFHYGGLYFDRIDESFPGFQSTVLDLIRRYPGDYSESRYLMFKRMFQFTREDTHFRDELRNMNPEAIYKHGRVVLGYQKKELPFTSAAEFVQEWIHIYMIRLPGPLHVLVASSLVPLLALCCFSFFWGSRLFLGPLALLVLCRTVFIITVAPAAYFKYVGSTWVVGWLFLFLFWNIVTRETSKTETL